MGRGAPAEPTEASLHEAALAYLARYAATRAGLLRVLNRRVAKWVAASEGLGDDAAAAARAAARRVADRLEAAGAVNDAVFATQRARSLKRAGKSARAIGAHLGAKGVPPELAAAAAQTDAPAELAAAALHLRKRRMGPFRLRETSPETRRRELGSLARAGFAHATAAAALGLTRDEAEAVIRAFHASQD
jgi:regulatory protein